MKIITKKEPLLQAVQIVQRFVSPRNPLPILSGILLELSSNSLTFLATDLEIGIKCTIFVDGLEDGSIVLPARQFFELVRRLPDGPIEIIAIEEKNSILIKYGKSEAKLYGFNSEEFPALPSYEGSSFSIKESLFKDMLKKVLFAVGTNENRPLFTGVLMEIKGDAIFLTASDTHRLSMYNTKLENLKEIQLGTSQKDIIVPGKVLSEIARLPGGSDRDLEVTISENQIFFSLSDTNIDDDFSSLRQVMIMSRLIEGKFPDFSDAIPDDFVAVAKVQVKDFWHAVERASLLVQDTSKVVKLDFQSEKLSISSYTETGRIYEEIPVSLEGDEMTIFYSARYLNDLLKVIEDDKILIHLSGPFNASVVRIEGNDCFKALILPVRKRDI